MGLASITGYYMYYVPFHLSVPSRIRTRIAFPALIGLWATFTTVRPVLRDRCLSVCLPVTLVYCGQTVAWIKMPLSTEVSLGPGDIALDGNTSPSRKGAQQSPPSCDRQTRLRIYTTLAWRRVVKIEREALSKKQQRNNCKPIFIS